MIKRLLLWLIKGYQFLLSPWIGNQCRFYPTCSEYAKQAITHHGSCKGSYLAAKRLCKCHPWHPGGFDPVPGTSLPSDDDTAAQHAPEKRRVSED